MSEKDLKTKKVSNTKHKPVLLKEVIENLNLKTGDIVLDGTVGGGGYLREICMAVGKRGFVVGIDQDKDALERAKDNLSEDFKEKICQCKLELINENFRNLDSVLRKLEIQEIQGFVIDIGLSSDQFEVSGRGFSFQKDEPLLMTFSSDLEKVDFTAKDIVNDWDEENIADILYGYGGERFSRKIAKNIVEARKEKPIETTFDLVEIIEKSISSKFKNRAKIHPATKTFQALRIAVNDELRALKEGLEKGFDALAQNGRMAVVSFHSSEDRIVKNFMRDKKNAGEGILISKKPLVPTREEVLENPRSRSAKLRILEKNNPNTTN